MVWGKSIALAMGMAVVAAAALSAGEEPDARDRAAAGLTSLKRNAVVSIGGEIRVDYSYRHSKTERISEQSPQPGIDSRDGDMRLRNTNLRLQADVHPNVRALMKIDFTPPSADGGRGDEILEEALLLMHSVGGGGLGFFAGKGRAPYGQDITLGMLQSYHHAANREDSSEGRIFINDSPASGGTGKRALPPMRPGQFDRAFLAGASYQWEDRWRVEAAAFKPGDSAFRERLARQGKEGSEAGIGAAARIWWRPTEEITLEASGMAARSAAMGRAYDRTDVRDGARGSGTAYALSLGFDWRRGPWRVFGEYQRGWNWNFTKEYATDAWQIGAARELGEGWRLGGMAEGLHIRDGARETVRDNYYKLALNVRYTFSSGFFILGEYGHEWFRRERGGGLWEKRGGDFFGMRVGFSF